ncbi:LamG domain-containing protein [Saccharomonospora iraqiensis]|uniref:LamG domain-containing protein n=1 Tax=Saccharomonospora iraqiensis TaxID=52698 RepID=UPI00022DE938|nr:LamG domain-containing protein [Saccharomonospora iraqiensis]
MRAQASRDLTLTHHMALNESAGTGTADSVGGRGGTLHNGASFVEGYVGNGVELDGTDDHVTTEAVDLRTDESFTVTSWVNLRERGGKVTAVSIDGEQTSKFRLGHVSDSRDRLGTWIFEVTDADDENGAVTDAAVSTLENEVDTWVHLTGVYDAPTDQVWLYVNGTRLGDGAVRDKWNATGGLAIGRGKEAGTHAQHWPGRVDDVRLYAGALGSDRVNDLYESYNEIEEPAPVEFPDGSALRVNDSGTSEALYLVVGGARIDVADEDEFLGTGRALDELMTAPHASLMTLPEVMRDGTRVRVPDSDQVWLIEDGRRSPTTDDGNAHVVPARTLDDYPETAV